MKDLERPSFLVLELVLFIALLIAKVTIPKSLYNGTVQIYQLSTKDKVLGVQNQELANLAIEIAACKFASIAALADLLAFAALHLHL
ncbi:hypothetical protein Tco_0098529 [Tanacetum coccineum]